MRVLVSGSNGFIGRAAIHELHARGIDYKHLDVSFGREHDVRTVDFGALLHDCDAVLNLSGKLGTHELFDHVEEAIDINTKGAARLLQAIDAENMHRLDAELMPIKYVGISMMDVWDNIYQATKIASERIAMAYHRHKDTRVTIVRAFNGYGPYQKVGGVQKIIPTFASCAWTNEPIPIWGDGSATVDLVHVDDIAGILVDAVFLPGGEKIDAGTSVPVSVLEVAERIIEHTGSTGGIDHKPMRLGEHELAEPLVAKGEGWEHITKQPTFDWDRVMETVNWYKTPRP